jgi:hypothetical protein
MHQSPVGIGQIALPIAIVVIATAEWRQIVGKAWRWIHVGAFFVYFGGALHGIFSGSDTRVSLISLMYVVTISSVIFLTVYQWFSDVALARQPTSYDVCSITHSVPWDARCRSSLSAPATATAVTLAIDSIAQWELVLSRFRPDSETQLPQPTFQPMAVM